MQRYDYYIQDSESWERPTVVGLMTSPAKIASVESLLKQTPTTTLDAITGDDEALQAAADQLSHKYISTMTRRLRDGEIAAPTTPPEDARAVYVYFSSKTGTCIYRCSVGFYQAFTAALKERYGEMYPSQMIEVLNKGLGRLYMRLATDDELATVTPEVPEFKDLIAKIEVREDDRDVMESFIKLMPTYVRNKFSVHAVANDA